MPRTPNESSTMSPAPVCMLKGPGNGAIEASDSACADGVTWTGDASSANCRWPTTQASSLSNTKTRR